jgi:hypothetical protein
MLAVTGKTRRGTLLDRLGVRRRGDQRKHQGRNCLLHGTVSTLARHCEERSDEAIH